MLSVDFYSLVQLTVVASVMLRIFLVFCVRLFQPFPLRDGSIYFGTAPWYFLSRYTSDFPEMLIPLTPNGLIVFLSRSVDISVQTCRRELGTSDGAHV